jgi:PadR family transcriptional regulator PadR
LEIQLKKGLLDAYVLALLRKGDTYGYKLLQDVSSVIEVSESTLYPVLRRLEMQGCLNLYQLEHNGRLRKYYRLTGDGIMRLEEYKRHLTDVKHIIDLIFERGVSI